MVVRSTVGVGIFSPPRTFAGPTGPSGAIVAWIMAAGGLCMLAKHARASS
jgi:arginine:ornithine antiporter/lysine permease